ncbi:MAG: hypothetical protein QNJ47_06150 [Nostocaceae cyanobacterium]|nr:hypothetical protein [Nostocaceae cyanobacterium]
MTTLAWQKALCGINDPPWDLVAIIGASSNSRGSNLAGMGR